MEETLDKMLDFVRESAETPEEMAGEMDELLAELRKAMLRAIGEASAEVDRILSVPTGTGTYSTNGDALILVINGETMALLTRK